MNDKNWSEMTPTERMIYASKAMKNPCPEGRHVFDDSVNIVGNDTMLSQICKVCFTFQGWVYLKDQD
jgi:hypothetical protein